MKNKKNLYILVPAVLLIWGLIAFKIFTFKEEDIQLPIPPLVSTQKKESNNQTEHIITADYTDPFIKTNAYTLQKEPTAKQTVQNKESNASQTKPVAITNKEAKWPQILYNGLVVNNTTGDKTAIVSINGKRKLLGYQDEINGVKLSVLYQDSVVLIYNSSFKTFYRNK